MKLFGWAAGLAGALILLWLIWSTFTVVPVERSSIEELTQTTGGSVDFPPPDVPDGQP